MKHKVVFVSVFSLLICAGAYCAYRYYQEDVLPVKQTEEAHDAQAALFVRLKPYVTLPDNAQQSVPEAAKAQHDLLAPAEAVLEAYVGVQVEIFALKG